MQLHGMYDVSDAIFLLPVLSNSTPNMHGTFLWGRLECSSFMSLTVSISLLCFLLEIVKRQHAAAFSVTGPLSFIVMIDNLRAPCESHKYIDDTTLSELIPSSCFTSDMPQIFYGRPME